MPDANVPSMTLQWLIQQGVLGVVLVLVLWDYRRTMLRINQDQASRDAAMNRKLEEDKGVLLAVVRENTKSNVELLATVNRWVRVTEESFPRGRWDDHSGGDR